MKKSKMEKIEDIIKMIGKIIYGALIVIIVICILWAIISYIEVFTKNVTENPVYNEWNLFQILAK